MAASYHRHGRHEPAVFELFVRRIPPNRNWLLVCGLGPVMRMITEMRFGPAELEYLGSADGDDEFLAYLEGLPLQRRHRGDARGHDRLRQRTARSGHRAADRGPAGRDAAPQPDQLPDDDRDEGGPGRAGAADGERRVGDGLLPQARPRRGCGDEGRPRLGDRRSSAGPRTWRPRCATGCVPVGTMAHSYVLSFDSEEEAFEAFMRENPDNALLLVDTYDTLEGVRRGDRGVTPHGAPADRHPHRLGGPGGARPRGPARGCSTRRDSMRR